MHGTPRKKRQQHLRFANIPCVADKDIAVQHDQIGIFSGCKTAGLSAAPGGGGGANRIAGHGFGAADALGRQKGRT